MFIPVPHYADQRNARQLKRRDGNECQRAAKASHQSRSNEDAIPTNLRMTRQHSPQSSRREASPSELQARFERQTWAGYWEPLRGSTAAGVSASIEPSSEKRASSSAMRRT